MESIKLMCLSVVVKTQQQRLQRERRLAAAAETTAAKDLRQIYGREVSPQL